MLAAGAAGLAWRRGDLRGWSAVVLRGRRGALAAILLLGALVANQAVGAGDASDSGLYHYQLVRWANEYPVVPGLANLSPNYGLNPASLLFVALVNTGPWAGRCEHVGNGLLLWALFAQVVLGFSRLCGRGFGNTAAYNALLLAPALFVLYSKEVSSPRTDFPPGIVILVVGWLLLALLEREDPAPAGRRASVIVITVLCALAACLKISAAFFTLPAWVLALAAWWIRERPAPRALLVTVSASVALSSVLVGAWIGRHVVLSGYPFFPSPHFGVPVEWAVPEDRAQWFLDTVVRHGQGHLAIWVHEPVQRSPLKWYAPLIKTPFQSWNDIEGWEWVRPWLFSLPITSPNEVVIPMLLAGAAWLVIAWRRLRRGAAAGPIGEAAWILAPAVIGIGLWFVLKPVPRFAYGMTWALAAASVPTALRVWMPSGGRRAVAAVLAIAGLLSVPAVLYRAAVNKAAYGMAPWDGIPFCGPGDDHGFGRRPTQENLIVKTTRWGLRVSAPASGSLCWDAPLPCSGYEGPSPDLRLRREGDLGSGFMVDEGPGR